MIFKQTFLAFCLLFIPSDAKDISISFVKPIHLKSMFYNTNGYKRSPPVLLNWQPFDGHKYLFVTEKINWENARDYCEGLTSTLVRIESQKENEWIYQQKKTEDLWTGGLRSYYGDFEWYDKNDELLFTNWYYSEPNNYLGMENCMQMSWQHRGEWKDSFCNIPSEFVCEKS